MKSSNLYHEVKTQDLDYFIFFNVKNVVDFWINKLNKDPYYFLNEESRKLVIPKINKLGRGFELNDFE